VPETSLTRYAPTSSAVNGKVCPSTIVRVYVPGMRDGVGDGPVVSRPHAASVNASAKNKAPRMGPPFEAIVVVPGAFG
jgi:hypothetical protein